VLGQVTVQITMTTSNDAGQGKVLQDTATFEVVSFDDNYAVQAIMVSDTSRGTPIDISGDFGFSRFPEGGSGYWEVLEGVANIQQPEFFGTRLVAESTGDVVLRLNMVDANDNVVAADEFTLFVIPSEFVSFGALLENLQVLGESTELEVFPSNYQVDEVDYSWSVVSGDVEIENADQRNPTVSVTGIGTAIVRGTAMTNGFNDGVTAEGDLDVAITTVADRHPRIEIDVEGYGIIPIELDAEASPLTVANFLHYVDDELYDGQVFHRVIADFVIQAGGFRAGADGELERVDPRTAISTEMPNGLSNVRGTISMALPPNQPNGGTQGFFINVEDNAELDEFFHTVFGTVVDGGMDVVDAIAQIPTDSADRPTTDIVINSIRRVDPPEDDETPEGGQAP
jgi:cyclophilin family peptidyl-prolyl cis-trans isomerase